MKERLGCQIESVQHISSRKSDPFQAVNLVSEQHVEGSRVGLHEKFIGFFDSIVICYNDSMQLDWCSNAVERVCLFQMYNDTFHIWTRPITPTGSYAIAATYSKQQGYPIHVTLPLSAINLTAPQGYNITEVFDNTAVGYLKPNQNLTYVVNPSGINLLRATVMQ